MKEIYIKGAIEFFKNAEYSMRVVREPLIIELTRDDLIKWESSIPIENVSIYDFKNSSITVDEIRKASLIIFKDGDKEIILKKVR